jgi:acyl carrier protein
VSTQTATPAAADDVQRRVKDFISTNFYVTDPQFLEPEAPLVDNGVIDSTGILEVISFLEAEYGIKVGDQEMLPANFGSIARIAAFVSRKRAA